MTAVPKKDSTMWYLEAVANTPGFSVAATSTGAKATNTGNGATVSFHLSDRDGAIRPGDLGKLKNLLGWTLDLYEAGRGNGRAERVQRSKAVGHRLNAALEQMGVYTTPPREEPAVPAVRRVVGETGESFTEEWITPERADELLDAIPVGKREDGSRAQRRPNKGRVEDYTWMMIRPEEWMTAPAPLVLHVNDEGKEYPSDGQQRLAAVRSSGTTQRFWVARGFPDDVFKVIDKNKARTVSDSLYVKGYDNQTLAASVVRICHLFDNEKDQRNWKDVRVSDEQTLVYLREHPEILESLPWSRASRFTHANNSALAIAHFLIRRYAGNDEAVEAWFQQLHKGGGGLDEGDPLLALRNWFSAAKDQKVIAKKLRVPARLLHTYMIIKAWNATQAGERVEKMTYTTPTKIPEPVKARVQVPAAQFADAG